MLATSNRNMASEVAAGRFREDLFYRLNVFPLLIPSLRERPGDIIPLDGTFWGCTAHDSAAWRKSAPGGGEPAVHPWPGNVRELENVMQRALILAPGDTIEAEHLLLPNSAGDAEIFSLPLPSRQSHRDFLRSRRLFLRVPLSQPVVTAEVPANMKDLERQHILETLAKVGGSRKKAIDLLGISERTLRYKLKQYRDEGFYSDSEQD